MKELFSFLKDLSANNNREWFQANRARYDAAREKLDEMARLFILAVEQHDPGAARLTPKDCTYRIYRDVRFSPDKSPYKTHMGIFVNPLGGKKGIECGYYLGLEPGRTVFTCGTYCLPSPVLRAVRQSIFDLTDEYLGIVEDPEFKRIFPTVGADPLKTAPKGFPKDWPHIDLIKPREFVAMTSLPDSFFYDEKGHPGSGPAEAGRRLAPYIAQAKRLNDFLNFTILEYSSLR